MPYYKWLKHPSDLKDVNLFVALEFCNAHYETYPYFIHFNWLVYSPLIEIKIMDFLGIPCGH